MHDFLIKELNNTNIETELKNIGFDTTYCKKACAKFEYKNIKIFDLTVAQANILKQTALSVGADCGTHKEVITGKKEISSCILGGSLSQLKKIAHKLQSQPFKLKKLSEQILSIIETTPQNRTKIVGVLNLTNDSFSDGGNYFKKEDAIQHLNQLIQDGADIIDIGAESTKPYSKEIPAFQQLEKIIPILEYIKSNNINIPISIDTRSAEVAQKCIALGANIINDVSGLDFDSEMTNLIKNNPQIKIIIQHSKGTPEVMQDDTNYDNLMDDIFLTLNKKVNNAIKKGIKKEQIIIDPGLGFGKSKEQNLEIIKRWQEFKTIGCPIMLGLSRKSLLGMETSTNEEKDLYTLALNSILINQNIDYVRVHNVKTHKTLQNILK
ncbi:MAG: dihydropteroate synthase [Cyanobacteria bacterium SIG26]|nr:dihydropteroate synthase [Cyanobacteria bacterium SIG26]